MSKEAMTYAGAHNIDAEKLRKMLPKGSNHKVTDEVIELIRGMEADTGLLQDYLEESLLSYLPVLGFVEAALSRFLFAGLFLNYLKL